MPENMLKDKGAKTDEGDSAKEKAKEAKAVDLTKTKVDPESIKLGISETRATLHKQKKFKIIVPSTESDKTDVPVTINGYCYLIKRDEEVIIPESVVEALNHAKMRVYTQKKRGDGQDGYELVGRDALRYPFQIIGQIGE